MEFSLQLLLERSGLDCKTCILHQTDSSVKYSDAALLPADISFCRSHRLYLCTASTLPNQLPDDAGLICLCNNSEEMTSFRDFYSEILLVFNDLLTLNSLFQKFSDAFSLLNHQVTAFFEAVHHQASLQKIVELFYDFLGNPAYLVDSSFRVLAIDKRKEIRELSVTWKHLEDDGYLSYNIVNGLIASKELQTMEATSCEMIYSDYFYCPFVNWNLCQKQHLLGHLFVVEILKKISPGDKELITLFGQFVTQAVSANPRYQRERGRYYEYSLTDILEGKINDPKQIDKQMQAMNYSPENFYVVVVIFVEEENFQGLAGERLLNVIEQFRKVKPIILDQHIVTIIPTLKEESEDQIQKEIDKLAVKYHFKAGISDIFQGFFPINVCYKQAICTLQHLISEYPSENTLLYQSCAMTHLLETIETSGQNFFFHQGLQILIEYDKRNHTDLTYTLKVFLESERNTVQTAQKLYIHRNTVSYRLHQIQELCHFNLEDPYIRERLLFSFQN